jgi:K+ transporter
MVTWHRGHNRLVAERRRMEGDLARFITSLDGGRRIPGVAVFPRPFMDTPPLALLCCVESFGVLDEHAVIVRVLAAGVPTCARATGSRCGTWARRRTGSSR